MSGQKACDSFMTGLGDWPVLAIKGHLQTCKDCEKQFQDMYDAYYHCDSTDLVGMVLNLEEHSIPPKLDKDAFLERWHLALFQKREMQEALIETIFEKLNTDEGLELLRRLLSRQSMVMAFIGANSPKRIISGQINMVMTALHQMKKLLGDNAFYYLCMSNLEHSIEDMFTDTLRGWEKVKKVLNSLAK